MATSRPVRAATVVLTAVFALSGWAVAPIEPGRIPLAVILLIVNVVPLLAVRDHPLAVLAWFSVAYPAWLLLGFPAHLLQSLPTLVAMYATGAWDRTLGIRAWGLATPVWMLVATVTGWWEASPLEIGYVAVMFVGVWVLGSVVADRERHAAVLQERTRELQRARRELADRAVADERARIARELHDVVAHAMSVITVQAGVGAHLVDDHPSQAASALSTIEHHGRQALVEMRRMLTVLRDPDVAGSATQPPQPGLADVPRLVEEARSAGVEVALTTRGRCPDDLPAGLELAVYRLVQEAVTNITKHAPGSRGRVTIVHRVDHLDVLVDNPLSSSAARSRPPDGHGLRGIAERVALYDGTLVTEVDDAGFHVRATFPALTPS